MEIRVSLGFGSHEGKQEAGFTKNPLEMHENPWHSMGFYLAVFPSFESPGSSIRMITGDITTAPGIPMVIRIHHDLSIFFGSLKLSLTNLDRENPADHRVQENGGVNFCHVPMLV